MSADNVELVRHIYEAWSRRDSPEALGLVAEDIEYVNPPDAVESGTRRGADAFTAARGSVAETFASLSVDVDDLIDAGDRVLALATLRGRGRASGVEIDRPQGHVWTVRDGRAVRFEWFNDREAARGSAGLPAPGE